jgi:D-3-phosphoglycerate dehydrogenase / 2-oxoglutarate reductase
MRGVSTKEPDAMTKPVVFLSQPIHPAGIERLKQHCEVIEGVYHPVASDAEIEAALARADAVVIRSMPIGADRQDKAPNLKVISKHGAGVDMIDIQAATTRGIVVANSGDANAFAVAQHAVALMLAVHRRVVFIDAMVRAGGYQQREKVGMRLGDLWETTIGFVGLGNIGRHAAEMVSGFRATKIAFDPMVSAEAMAAIGVEKVDDLHDLLRRADTVSLHVPLIPATHHLIDATALAAMKPTAVLVNTSRGGIVNEAALLAALSEGRIAGAGLDVMEHEPPAADDPLFAETGRLILSPHVGGGSEVALAKTALAAADAILAVLAGKRPAHLLNDDVLAAARAAIAA